LKNRAENVLISPFFFVLIIISSIILPFYSVTSLSVTVTTDKPAYDPGDIIQIYGNLTLDESLVTDGLVGIQVQTPEDSLLAIRTVNTGANPPETPYVEVLSVVPCNSSGELQETFKRGSLSYFKITVRNHDHVEPRDALITVNTYDQNNIPFGSASVETTIHQQTTTTTIISIPIPSDATTGNSTAYANAYTGWPIEEIELGIHGTPYCPEVYATFEIIDGSFQAATSTTRNHTPATQEINGNYNLTFQLTPQATPGNYSIYVSSRYWGEETFNNTKFKVLLLGDFDGDGDIDFDDIVYFADAYILYWTGGSADPKCDFDCDGDIDFDDIVNFAAAYIEYWS
jgi:hypothetical protein